MKHYVTATCEHCNNETEIECNSLKDFKTIEAVNCSKCNKPIYLNGYKPKTETPNHTEGHPQMKKINVDDLNGLTQTNYKVITVTIQEAHPIKFSEECEKLLKATNPEALIYYAISNVPIQTPNGTALVYIVNLQFWGTEEEFKEWEADIRRKALFIKP